MTYREFLQRLLTITIFVIVLLGVWYLRNILMLGFTAAMLAVGLSVPSRWLQNWGLQRGMANIVAVIGVLTLTTLLGFWIFPTVIKELTNLISGLPVALIRVAQAYEIWRESSANLSTILPTLNFTELSTTLNTLGIESSNISSLAMPLVNSTLPILRGVGNVVFGVTANLAIVVLASIFFLVEPASYIRASLMLVPHDYQARTLEIWNELYNALTNWISAQFISITITVFLVWFVLGVLLEMPHAMAVALFAGVATFVPNLGSIIPLVPIIIFTAADDPTKLLLVVPAYLTIQLLESNVLTPTIIKLELNIPAGGLLIFQLISATLLGALGVLLAIPLLAVVLTLVREIYSYDILRLNRRSTAFVTQKGGGVRILDPAPLLPASEDNGRSTPKPLADPTNYPSA